MSLIRFWKLDETTGTTATATVGTSGTYARNASITTASGPGTQITNSQNFDGTSDYVDVSSSPISFASGSAFSLSGWCKFDASSGALFGKSGNTQSRFAKTNDTTILISGSSTSLNFTVPALGTTNWHHLLVTRTTGNSVRVFVDGVESTTSAQTLSETCAPGRIGWSNTAGFDGKIAWLKVFDSDESASAATLYGEANLPPVDPPPIFEGDTYDAEYHIGLIAEDDSPTTATFNTNCLNEALEAQWAGGYFAFANGDRGPVLRPICFAPKRFFFNNTIETSVRIGGGICGAGGLDYPIIESAFDEAGLPGGNLAQLIRIDDDSDAPMLRIRGYGFVVDGLALKGRRWDESGFAGDRCQTGIEIESRPRPKTGGHVIRNCSLFECTTGIKALAGYYDDGAFTSSENPIERCTIETVRVDGCESCFRSENRYATGWSFSDLAFAQNDVDSDGVVFDIVRGGNLAADGVNLNHNKVTLLKVTDYFSDANQLRCDNLRWINYDPAAANYLTLFKYNGTTGDDCSLLKWSVRVSGQLANSDFVPVYDYSRLIDIPMDATSFPTDDIKLDIQHLPSSGFSHDGSYLIPTTANYFSPGKTVQLVAHTIIASTNTESITTSSINTDTTKASLIVAIVGFAGGIDPFPNLTDSRGNVWIMMPHVSSRDYDGPNNGFVNLRAFYCVDPLTSTAHTFTTAGGHGGYPSLGVMAFKNAGDLLASTARWADAPDAIGDTAQPGIIKPKLPGSLLVSAVIANSYPAGEASNFTIDSGFTAYSVDQNPAQGVGIAYKIQDEPISENPTWSWDTNAVRTAIMLAFRPTPTITPEHPSI
jgi:hypothetical protein